MLVNYTARDEIFDNILIIFSVYYNRIIYIIVGGVFYSTNGGSSWTESTGAPTGKKWYSIASSSTGEFVVAGSHESHGKCLISIDAFEYIFNKKLYS